MPKCNNNEATPHQQDKTQQRNNAMKVGRTWARGMQGASGRAAGTMERPPFFLIFNTILLTYPPHPLPPHQNTKDMPIQACLSCLSYFLCPHTENRPNWACFQCSVLLPFHQDTKNTPISAHFSCLHRLLPLNTNHTFIWMHFWCSAVTTSPFKH